MSRRRVVITGIGPVSAAGVGAAAFWAGLVEGRSGVARIDAYDPSGFACKLGGQVRGVEIKDFVPKSYRKATKVMARDTELAVIAAKLAAEDAGLVTRGSEEGAPGFAIDAKRSGCQIGAGLIAAETEELSRAMVTAQDGSCGWDLKKWGTEGPEAGGGMNNLPPLWLLKYLPNMLACHVTIIHGLEGPSNTITCAEASGLLSIGEAARVIERGDAELCFAGGAESKINLMGHLRLELARRLAETGDAGDAAEVRRVCRPFDAGSSGGVPGEGGGILVLEEAEHARRRGARVYAEVAGFGAAQSPSPVFPGLFDAPRPEAMDPGERRAISAALRDAGVSGGEIDAVVPLGLGVPMLDAAEAGAIDAALGDGSGGRWQGLPRLTLVERVGNCMAGHGGLTAAAGALAVAHGMVPGGSGRGAGAAGGGVHARAGRSGGGVGAAVGGVRREAGCGGGDFGGVFGWCAWGVDRTGRGGDNRGLARAVARRGRVLGSSTRSTGVWHARSA